MSAAEAPAASGGETAAAHSGLRWFWVVVAVLTLLHVVLAAVLPVSGDEAYYWDCSRHLDWSYFDQPPLVIWAMVPFRAVLGEGRLATRAPAVLASVILAVCLLPLARRLGGGPRHATAAYLVLHATPLFFIGSFYASTDVVMNTAWVAATWAAVALAQGEGRAWWGFGAATGLGFLAKFPIVLVLPALLPVLLRRGGLRQLREPRPWLAAGLAALLTAPVWIWAVRHDWDNIAFQLVGRHDRGGPTLKYLGELLAADLVLLSPFLLAALVVAWLVAFRRHRREPGWQVVLVAAAMPVVFFSLTALKTRVAPHWTAPAVVLSGLMLALVRWRGRWVMAAAGAVMGLTLSGLVIFVALAPERVVGIEWSWRGRPQRVNTAKLAAAIGNQELVEKIAARRRPEELVASESYTNVHLWALLSGGVMPTRLANVNHGIHGLASLYWYRPEELRGRDVLFVTKSRRIDEELVRRFAAVEEEAPIEIRRDNEVVRSFRVLRCRDLLEAEGAFTRLR